MTGEATGPRRFLGPAAEVVVAIAAAGLFTLTCTNIKVEPLDRIGQVAGLAFLGFRFTVVAVVLVAILVVAARLRGGAAFAMTSRLVCAAIAGLTSGMVAGGIVIALRGTSWGLFGDEGDAGAIAQWAEALQHGRDMNPTYPPLPIHALAWYADLFDMPTGFAVKHLQILGTAMLGPAAYLSWRLVLRPGWALGIGLVAALPFIDSAPYKPYGNLILLVFIPISIRFLQILRRSADASVLDMARRGALYGGVFGVMFLTYSGWFQWSAPGFLVALLIVFPWRAAPRRALVFLGFAGLMFAMLAGRLLLATLEAPGIADAYKYFDVYADPAYVAMFRGDLHGPFGGVWPPLGELGGVGLFTVGMAAGLGLAVALGRGRTLVIGVGSIMVGAWLMRFWLAHLMWKTKLMQLYPRTTLEILYCLLILAGFAIYLLVERAARKAAADGGPEKSGPDAVPSPIYGPSGLIGAVCGLLLLFGSAGSAISDHYMPNNTAPLGTGYFAWYAHHVKPKVGDAPP